jgi:hypothetical protein
MTVFGALSLHPLAVIFLCLGLIGIGLMIFYYRYSTDLSHDSDQRRKVWFWWVASICAHVAIIAFMQWFVGRVGCVPFSPVSVMAGYLLLITPVSVGMIIGSGLILGIDFAVWRTIVRRSLAEQGIPPNA